MPHPRHLNDNCDGNVDYYVRLLGHANKVTGNSTEGYVIQDVRQGIYNLQYEATDCCGNVTREIVKLSISDNTPPITVTTENIVVDLTFAGFGEGTAKIFAQSIDNGSYDSCGDVDISIRRSGNCTESDTLWRDFVTFCCADLKDQPFALIDVELRALDWLGNENRAWSTVRLEDKGGGAVICPPDMVLTCETDFQNLSVTRGVPQSFTACELLPGSIDTLQILSDTEPRRKRANEGTVPGYIGVEVVAYNPACGFGAVRRQYDQCTQWLVIEPVAQVFDPATIQFPGDTTTTCEGEVTSEEPSWIDATCSLVGVTLETDTFRIESTVCAQVVHW